MALLLALIYDPSIRSGDLPLSYLIGDSPLRALAIAALCFAGVPNYLGGKQFIAGH